MALCQSWHFNMFASKFNFFIFRYAKVNEFIALSKTQSCLCFHLGWWLIWCFRKYLSNKWWTWNVPYKFLPLLYGKQFSSLNRVFWLVNFRSGFYSTDHYYGNSHFWIFCFALPLPQNSNSENARRLKKERPVWSCYKTGLNEVNTPV